MDAEKFVRAGVRMTAKRLTDEELVALNLVMQLNSDPRGILGYEKASSLFTVQGEHPLAHAVVKEEFTKIVLERIPE